MKIIAKAIAALIALTSMTLGVRAADLPTAPEYKAPYQAPAAVYNWTGVYLGVNGGYGWGGQDPFNLFTSRFDALSVPFNGWLFGGTAGAQIQSGHVVLGVEADIDWANITGSATVVPTVAGIPIAGGAATTTTKIDDVSTGRLRVGYALDNWLLYATAGMALVGGNTNVSTVGGFACTVALLTAVCSGTSHRIGATAGAGLEYGITQNLSAKFEYLYVAAASLEISHINEVRLGVNYRFGGI
jgi:outer membrane immunogenic protein